MTEAARIRAGRDNDADQLIALIWACWSRYPGVRLDVDAEMPELRALATYYAQAGGALWVAEADGHIVGMIATRPYPDNAAVAGDAQQAWEPCRVYVHPSLHGAGLGKTLLDIAEAHARQAGATHILLWSDTRFDRAHRFYEKYSYVRAGPIRALQDISQSLEFAYAKPVDGIERLDAAGAASAERRLAEILAACVDAGDSVGFLPPLSAAAARSVWKRISSGVAASGNLLLCAWSDGVLVGAAVLRLDVPAEQAHRAEVPMLLLHPDARGRGLGRALLQQAEQSAARAGRTLLTMNMASGGAAEQLCRSLAWQELGRIPGYVHAREKAGAQSFFWKQLPSPHPSSVSPGPSIPS